MNSFEPPKMPGLNPGEIPGMPEMVSLPDMHAEAMEARRDLKSEMEKTNEKLDSIQKTLALIHDALVEQMKNPPR